jgi:hypothetical protein
MLPPSEKGAVGLFCRIPAPLTTLLIAGFSPLEGGMIVNDPLPITHQVRAQPIIGKKENGPSATFMGNASTEAYVKGEIAHVWAQSGVAIQWELAVEFVDDFTCRGSPGHQKVIPKTLTNCRSWRCLPIAGVLS